MQNNILDWLNHPSQSTEVFARMIDQLQDRMDKKLDTDIFAEWKKNRFIVADQALIEDVYEGKHLIVLTDIMYWAERAEELAQWCADVGCRTSGMTVELDTDEQLTAFTLRWA